MGRLLLDRGDAGSALREFDRYLSEGSGILDEEALVGRALAFKAMGRSDEEVETWSRVLSKYPHSAYARQAKARLAVSGRP